MGFPVGDSVIGLDSALPAALLDALATQLAGFDCVHGAPLGDMVAPLAAWLVAGALRDTFCTSV